MCCVSAVLAAVVSDGAGTVAGVLYGGQYPQFHFESSSTFSPLWHLNLSFLVLLHPCLCLFGVRKALSMSQDRLRNAGSAEWVRPLIHFHDGCGRG